MKTKINTAISTELTGSNLTRAMLNRSDQPVWCAVSDDSDEEAIQDLVNNDFTAFISSFNEYQFYSSSGVHWSFAVPIKVCAITETEAGLDQYDYLYVNVKRGLTLLSRLLDPTIATQNARPI